MTTRQILDKSYLIRRIDNWMVKVKDNKILGTIKPFGLNIDSNVCGEIISYVDKHVMTKIGCRLYALVLGDIDPCKSHYKCLYLQHIKSKSIEFNVLI